MSEDTNALTPQELIERTQSDLEKLREIVEASDVTTQNDKDAINTLKNNFKEFVQSNLNQDPGFDEETPVLGGLPNEAGAADVKPVL